jgi:CheY-like chemotaxis protein
VTDQKPVLVIEDDEALRLIVSRHLRGKRLPVVEAATAEEAVAQLQRGVRPGAVLLDVNLPGDTGWDLLRSGVLASAGSPPVVITSAGAVNPKRLAEFGCAGWLPKPFPLETLVDTFNRLMSQTRPGEPNEERGDS